MKIKLLFVVLLALAGSFVFAGCNKGDTTETPTAPTMPSTNSMSTNAP